MRFLTVALCCLMIAGCSCNCRKSSINPGAYTSQQESYYVPTVIEEDYVPARGKVFHVAGFDIQQGQQMRDFFDDFEEPMHTYYNGDEVDWTYYVDYDRAHDDGKIVRYCELDNYRPHSLCAVKVKFTNTYVSDAVTNCR